MADLFFAMQGVLLPAFRFFPWSNISVFSRKFDLPPPSGFLLGAVSIPDEFPLLLIALQLALEVLFGLLRWFVVYSSGSSTFLLPVVFCLEEFLSG